MTYEDIVEKLVSEVGEHIEEYGFLVAFNHARSAQQLEEDEITSTRKLVSKLLRMNYHERRSFLMEMRLNKFASTAH